MAPFGGGMEHQTMTSLGFFDYYIDAQYKPQYAADIEVKMNSQLKEVIYNRIITLMKKGKIFETMKEFDGKYERINFNFRYNLKDGTVLKKSYYVYYADLVPIIPYLNKDDFFNILRT